LMRAGKIVRFHAETSGGPCFPCHIVRRVSQSNPRRPYSE
jgi:hypothetical protein